ncbi:MAG: DUF2971 domain-containing protein [Flavobacteriaceae bacterium]
MKKKSGIVYKYRNLIDKNHRAMLLKNEVYLSAPNDFNDPFDCKININHHLLDTDEKKEFYIKKGTKENINLLIKNNKNIEEEENKLRKNLRNIDEYQKEYERRNSKYINNSIGVLSLSRRWNSILMWSHYGDYHKGYCIGFDEKVLIDSRCFEYGGDVNYTPDFPEIHPLKNYDVMQKVFWQTHYKAKEWEYEEEFRLTNLYFDKTNEELNRVVNVPENSIAEVIFGLNSEKDNKTEIIKECKSRNIPVYQLFKDNYKFEIKRKLIN